MERRHSAESDLTAAIAPNARPPESRRALPDLPPWGWAALLAGAGLALFLGFQLSLGLQAGRVARSAEAPAGARP